MTPETEDTSDGSEDWISAVIQKARGKHLTVSANVYDSLEELLREQISDRKLTPANLKVLVTQLLGDMTPKQSEPEEKQ